MRVKRIESKYKNIEIKLLRYVSVFVFIYLAYSLAQNVEVTLRAKSQLEKLQNEYDKNQKELSEIQEKISEVTSDFYIEKQIRDQLGLAKEGEIVVVFPDDEVLRSMIPDIEEENYTPQANWQKWIEMFLKW